MSHRDSLAFPAVDAEDVRYVKLGEGGEWEAACIEEGTLRFGFWTGEDAVYAACHARDWDALRALFRQRTSPGHATRSCNEIRQFVEDQGTTLWITFVGERMYWGLLEPGRPERHPDGGGIYRRIVGGWKWQDANGEPLEKDRLSGALVKVVMYRGASCSVDRDYVVNRINGRKTPAVEDAIRARKAAVDAIVPLVQMLDWKDFEVLVGLVFSTSGWRRLAEIGKTRKDVDITLVLPSTEERAAIQVKSRTTQRELDRYIEGLDPGFGRFFFVHHSGPSVKTDDERVRVLGPQELAPMVLNAGLMDWLIERTS